MSEELSYFRQDDGYTLVGELPGVPGLYPAARFKYRPAAPVTRLRYQDANGAAGREQVGSEIISLNVTDLRSPDSSGAGVRLTPDQAKRLHADLWNGLLNHCLGYVGPKIEDMEKNSAPPSASG